MAAGTSRPGFSSLEQKRFAPAGRVDEHIIRFNRRITLTSAAAITPVSVLSDFSGTLNVPYPTGTDARLVDVPIGYQVVIESVKFDVTGVTAWATMTFVELQDNAGLSLVRFNVAQLTANVHLNDYSASVVLGTNFKNLGGVCALSKGLQVKADANGTGSDILVTVTGYIEKIV